MTNINLLTEGNALNTIFFNKSHKGKLHVTFAKQSKIISSKTTKRKCTIELKVH